MTSEIIDTAVVAELQETMGDDFAAELIDTFLQEAPGMLADLAKAEADGDSDGFRRAAHSLKSNANIFGASALAAAARDLELNGPHPGASDELANVYANCENALRSFLDG